MAYHGCVFIMAIIIATYNLGEISYRVSAETVDDAVNIDDDDLDPTDPPGFDPDADDDLDPTDPPGFDPDADDDDTDDDLDPTDPPGFDDDDDTDYGSGDDTDALNTTETADTTGTYDDPDTDDDGTGTVAGTEIGSGDNVNIDYDDDKISEEESKADYNELMNAIDETRHRTTTSKMKTYSSTMSQKKQKHEWQKNRPPGMSPETWEYQRPTPSGLKDDYDDDDDDDNDDDSDSDSDEDDGNISIKRHEEKLEYKNIILIVSVVVSVLIVIGIVVIVIVYCVKKRRRYTRYQNFPPPPIRPVQPVFRGKNNSIPNLNYRIEARSTINSEMQTLKTQV